MTPIFFRLVRNPGSDLSNADLSGATLWDAILIQANLIHANLSGAKLAGAKFRKANLQCANFRGIDSSFMTQINYYEIYSERYNKLDFTEADLTNADLTGADIIGANFSKTKLTGTKLIATQAIATNFTNSNFTGAFIQDWNINDKTKLDEVVCDYIYLKNNKERYPYSFRNNFAPGEFTKLFQQAQETIDLIFSNGIDWQAFLTSFQKLQVECSGEELTIQAIENKNNGAFVIRVNVPADGNKAEIEKYLKREYELALMALEEKYQAQLQGKNEQIDIYRKQSTDLTEIVKLLAGRATYDLRNSQIGGNLINAEIVNTDEIGGSIHNNNA
ncbi:MAG: pentapeptide repeat-containing protein [Nostoc sp. EkiNYC01]